MAAAESPGARHRFPEPRALQLCGEGGKVAALRACLCPMGPSVCRETGGWCVVVFNTQGQYRGQGGNSQDWDMAGALEGHQGGSHRLGDGLCLTSCSGNSFLPFFLLLKNTCWSWWSWKVKHSPSCQAQHSGRDGILSHAPGLIFFAAAVSKQKQSSWPQGRPAAWVRAQQARSLLLGCFPSVNSASSPAGTRKKKKRGKLSKWYSSVAVGTVHFQHFSHPSRRGFSPLRLLMFQPRQNKRDTQRTALLLAGHSVSSSLSELRAVWFAD